MRPALNYRRNSKSDAAQRIFFRILLLLIIKENPTFLYSSAQAIVKRQVGSQLQRWSESELA
jgi:hypothetical protein